MCICDHFVSTLEHFVCNFIPESLLVVMNSCVLSTSWRWRDEPDVTTGCIDVLLISDSFGGGLAVKHIYFTANLISYHQYRLLLIKKFGLI